VHSEEAWRQWRESGASAALWVGDEPALARAAAALEAAGVRVVGLTGALLARFDDAPALAQRELESPGRLAPASERGAVQTAVEAAFDRLVDELGDESVGVADCELALARGLDLRRLATGRKVLFLIPGEQRGQRARLFAAGAQRPGLPAPEWLERSWDLGHDPA
jgi:hypothetical protein